MCVCLCVRVFGVALRCVGAMWTNDKIAKCSFSVRTEIAKALRVDPKGGTIIQLEV